MTNFHGDKANKKNSSLKVSIASLMGLPGNYKKFQGRNPYNIFVAIPVKMMTPTRHFEINWPLAGSTNSTSAFCSIGQVFESSNSWIFGPNWLLQLPLVLTFKKIPTAAYIFLTSWLWCDMIMARQLHNIGALYKCPQSLSFRLCLPLQLCYYTEDERTSSWL